MARKSNEIKSEIKDLENEYIAAIKTESQEWFEQNKNKWFAKDDDYFLILGTNESSFVETLKCSTTFRGWEISKTQFTYGFDGLIEINSDYYKIKEIEEFLRSALSHFISKNEEANDDGKK